MFENPRRGRRAKTFTTTVPKILDQIVFRTDIFRKLQLGAPVLYFLYITSEVKQYHEALFLSYRPRTECSISQFCNTNCTRSIFRTIEARVGFWLTVVCETKWNEMKGKSVVCEMGICSLRNGNL